MIVRTRVNSAIPISTVRVTLIAHRAKRSVSTLPTRENVRSQAHGLIVAMIRTIRAVPKKG